jgi:Asp-tRNA(Asn)/Glu-tRNA(Gln) amidotransferase A subunit family amidase
MSIKDTIDVAGAPTTCASFSRLHTEPRVSDASLVAKLKSEGAVIIGKANCHEFAFGGPAFDLPFPPARNPWDPNLFPGGSSSGSAVSVAAGFCHAAIGTDTAGSVRLPSSHCGLVGLKLTNGSIPLDGVEPLSPSFDSIGPFTRSVADAALIFDTLVGPNGSGRKPETGTIAVPDTDWLNSIGCEVDAVAAFEAAQNAALDAGFEVREVILPPLADIHAATAVVMMREVADIYAASVRVEFETFGEMFRARALLGEQITDRSYRHALVRCAEIANLYTAEMADHSALLLPGYPSGPGPLGVVDKFYFLQRPNINAIANGTGMPVLSLPVLRDAVRRPLGIQLMAARYEEPELLQAGKRLEEKLNYPHQLPFETKVENSNREEPLP